MIFMMPIIQLLVLPLAADFEIKNINISIVDHDRSEYSNDLINAVTSSGYFQLVSFGDSYQAAMNEIELDASDLILEIPSHFEQNLIKDGAQQVFIAVNAINGTKAGLGASYLNSIIQNFNQNIMVDAIASGNAAPLKNIEVVSLNWFNPNMNYKIFMVPAILVLLVTMVGAYMCSLNIVKEKEVGTIEQINVTPIKKHLYILGKMIPFLVIGIFIFTIGFFVVARLVYQIVPLGNLFLLYGYLFLFLVALLGFGLLISTYSQTQQQAMSIAFFFMMVFILMSGLFTPIESMPEWAKYIAYSNPVTYFIEVMRMVVLKGSMLKNITNHIYVMIGFAIFFNTWAVMNYRKTS